MKDEFVAMVGILNAKLQEQEEKIQFLTKEGASFRASWNEAELKCANFAQQLDAANKKILALESYASWVWF